MNHLYRLGAALLCLAALRGPAAAADATTPAPVPAPVAADPWIVSVGVTPSLGPAYDGANSARMSFAPDFSWRRASEPEGYSAPDDSFSLDLLNFRGFTFGPAASYRAGRYYSDEHDLFGLRKISWTIEAGAFAQYWLLPGQLRARVEVRQGFHGHHGLLADFSLDAMHRFGRFLVAIGPRLTLANTRFMNRNFSISPAEAAINGRVTPFSAEGGVKSVGLMASVGYRWSPEWKTVAYARYDRLTGDAAKSGIVARIGQRDQVTVGLTLTRSFALTF